LGHKSRPEMLQRLCTTFGDDKENFIRQIMHQEFNNSGNRYKDLTVSATLLFKRQLTKSLLHVV